MPLSSVHSVPTQLFDQQILVADKFLDPPPPLSLRSESTRTSAPNGNYIQHFGPREDAYAFLRSIQLRHPDIPDHEPYELWPTPQHILLLPQSYYEFDTHSPS
ncbi:hypothetical protein BDZ97DRAFT_1959146 [Flammula alnicola]|nr:hypothetical protein BDZ97DRAFT_1959146 [Flammula alnicola]